MRCDSLYFKSFDGMCCSNDLCACGIFMCFCLSARSNNFVGWVYNLSFSKLQFKCIWNPLCSWLSFKTSFDHSFCNWFHLMPHWTQLLSLSNSVFQLSGPSLWAKDYWALRIFDSSESDMRFQDVFNDRHFFLVHIDLNNFRFGKFG